jgi:ParB-like chromosome segregation protein Spo0J
MDIQKISIDKLNPAAYNPRKDLKPGDPEYEKLKKSIIEFDYIDPIVWNKRTGNIIGGHQRFKILQELGKEEIEVSVVDLDETKEKALNLALNKTGGDWDLPALKDLLQELKVSDIDIEITGFDEAELEKLNAKFDPIDIYEEENETPDREPQKEIYHCPKCGFEFEV